MSMKHIEEVRSEIESVMSSSRTIDKDDLIVSNYVKNLEDVIVKEEQIELEKAKLKIQETESKSKRKLEKARLDNEKSLKDREMDLKEREMDLREREMDVKEREMTLAENKLEVEKARIESDERIAERQANNQIATFVGNMILGGSKILSFVTLGLIDMNNTYRDDGRTSRFFNRMHDKSIQG